MVLDEKTRQLWNPLAHSNRGWEGDKIFADVPSGEPMWAEVSTYEGQGRGANVRAVIHVHSPSEIDGGEWSHGKGGSGQTKPIE